MKKLNEVDCLKGLKNLNLLSEDGEYLLKDLEKKECNCINRIANDNEKHNGQGIITDTNPNCPIHKKEGLQ